MQFAKSFFACIRSSHWLLGVLLLSILAMPSPSAQAAVTFSEPGFVSEVVISPLGSPVPLTDLTSFAWTPTGDKLFLAHKSGRVTVATHNVDGTYQILSASFANIGFEANNVNDRGLVSITVDPAWPTKPYLYLLFVYDPPEIQSFVPGPGETTRGAPNGGGSRVSRLIRIEANPAQAYNRAKFVTGAEPIELVLLGNNSTYANIGDPVGDFSPTMPPSCENNGIYVEDCLPIDSSTHSVGQVQFGPDGKLWVSTGDGAEFNFVDPKALRVLDVDSLAGKILRINPDTGQGLSDNPFYDGDPTSNRSRVVSYGLRNPFRYTLHPTTGELYIGDVGWNVWEEINRGKGKNFGWPCYEGNNAGNLEQPGYKNDTATSSTCASLYSNAATVTAPLYSYPQIHSDGAALAGAFYTGTDYPGRYRDSLFVFDYALNRIQYLTFDGPNGTGNATAHDFATDLAPNGGAPVQLSRGPGGDTDLYYVVLNGDNSELRRIRYTGDNTPPDAVMNASPTDGLTPLTVNFSATGSSDVDGDYPLSYSWNFGDGSPLATGSTASHVYTMTGTFQAVLTVTDSRGEVSTVQRTISPGNNAPVVQITAPISGTTYRVVLDTLTFSATASDAQDITIPAAQIEWRGILHHDNHIHPDVPIQVNANHLGGSLTPEDHGDNTWVELCVTVTDSGGLSASDCIELRPKKVAYTFASSPSGLLITYEGISYATPFTMQTNQNATQQIIVSPIQGAYSFSGWFNGTSPLSSLSSYNLHIGNTPKTISAHYVLTSPPQRHIYLPRIRR